MTQLEIIDKLREQREKETDYKLTWPKIAYCFIPAKWKIILKICQIIDILGMAEMHRHCLFFCRYPSTTKLNFAASAAVSIHHPSHVDMTLGNN